MHRRSFVTIATGLALLAGMAFAAPAPAASVHQDSSTWEHTSACGYWTNEDPGPGMHEYVAVCGHVWSASYQSRWISTTDGSFVGTGSSSIPAHYSLEARRHLCSAVAPTCQTESFVRWDVTAAQVAIDLEAGTAHLAAQIQSCSIDVSVAASEHFEDDSTVPTWEGFTYYPPTSLYSRFRSHDSETMSGAAVGSACDWEDIVVGQGYGSIGRYHGQADDLRVYGGV